MLPEYQIKSLLQLTFSILWNCLDFREINKKGSEYKNQIQNKSTGTPKNIKSSSEKNRRRKKKKVNPYSEKRVQKLTHLNPFCFFLLKYFFTEPFLFQSVFSIFYFHYLNLIFSDGFLFHYQISFFKNLISKKKLFVRFEIH